MEHFGKNSSLISSKRNFKIKDTVIRSRDRKVLEGEKKIIWQTESKIWEHIRFNEKLIQRLEFFLAKIK